MMTYINPAKMELSNSNTCLQRVPLGEEHHLIHGAYGHDIQMDT